ncbi:hypothetical protein OG775_28645 [Streptomyces platensis]|uniref:hypothetical protein n=1 Tax=Streptomyces platensis TaxID=58346 RepID=UPI0022545034|nr:hypothetical protein [Streptomyces platensis]MCX4639043.1 hypothetical protein [Streptomyces platensis]
MRRANLTYPDGTWSGLTLETEGRPRPELCLLTAEHRLLLTQGGDPVLLGVVHPPAYGVDFFRTDRYRSPVPPLRAQTVQAYGGSTERWAHRFADLLASSPGTPLHDGRWVLSPDPRLRHGNHGRRPLAEYWSAMLIDGHPDGYVDWYVHNGSWEILPLRPMPDADDSRVKAYRKQARDGTLPPVLLWWVSGLDCHLILDGHARLAAAIAESTEPRLLELHRTVPDDEADTETRRAVAAYEAELTRFAELRVLHGPGIPDGAEFAGPALTRRLDAARTGRRPTWAWPLPGGTAEWTRIAHEHTAGRWDHDELS